MKEELNFPLPYDYRLIDDTYHFTTISGVQYIAYFVDISSAFDVENVYSFGFDRKYDILASRDAVHIKYDVRVNATVVEILRHFFKNNGNVMLFTCYDLDKKEAGRSRLFQRWFTTFATDEFDKVDGNAANTFNSIILHRAHPEYHIIVAKFKLFMSYFEYDD